MKTGSSFQDELAFLRETPHVIRSLSQEFSELALRWRPPAQEFSLLEHVCHLRDIEVEGYCERIQKILSETNPLLYQIDGAELAAERNYNQQSFAKALAAFALARRDNLQQIRNAAPSSLKRTGRLAGLGTIDLKHVVTLMYDHDEGHRREIETVARRLRERLDQER